MQSIPIVDFSPFASTTNTDARIRQQRSKQLHEAVRFNGCVGFVGHGVSSELLQQAFAVSKQLFDLPYADKMKAPHPGKERGAVKMARETDDEDLKQQYMSTADYKESYEIGSEENLVGYNIWLPEDTLPSFRDFTTRFF
jgi:isopenicillin N synthase-like dioxygenase